MQHYTLSETFEAESVPFHLQYVWDSFLDRKTSLTWDEPEDIQFLKEAHRICHALQDTDWAEPALKALDMDTDPTLTRSLEYRRRFLCRVILNLPQPFLLPPDLLALCLKVTKSACRQTIQYWLKLGLLDVVDHEGQSRLFKRRLLSLDGLPTRKS